MWQTEKVGKTRRRLITGLFCISLFAVDVASVTSVWAQENTAAVEQTQGSDENGAGEARTPDDGNREWAAENPGEDNGESKLTNPGGEGGENQTKNPDEEKEGEGEQNPDDEKGGDNAQNPGDGEDGDDAQNSGDGTDGNDIQNPDDGKDGDEAQNPGDGTDRDNTQNPDEGDTVTDDPEEEPGASKEDETPEEEEEKDSVSDNSVSENDMEVMGEVRALAVPADAIASGTYENITWVIDKDGKLTVEGTGDFAEPGKMYITDRAPWCKDFSTRGKIKTAEIRVTGMTDASYMFFWCSNLTSVSFAGSDTSAVTNMSDMFSRCFKLKNIDFGQNFNTGNVTDMSSMFSECEVLDDLNLSGWDTANVTDMESMFRNCGFHRLTLGGSFTTRSVTDMGMMFACNPKFGNQDRIGLKWLDLSWLDLSSVNSMYGMFANCDVKQLDFDRLNTDGVTSLLGLFIACDVTGMDFSELRTDTVTNMRMMFGCPRGEIDLHTLNTEHVTDMSAMFADIMMVDQYFTFGGSSVTKIDLSGLNTENVTDIDEMFANQDNLTSVNLSGLDFGKIRYMDSIFYGCSSLSSVNLSGIDIDNLKDFSSLFSGCTNLKEVKLGDIGKNIINLDVNVEGTIQKNYINSTSWMFSGCSSLESLDLSNFNYSNIGASKSDWIFRECDKLTTIYTPYNVAKEIPLPEGDWYMADGTKLTDNCLPKNLSYSVLIQKGSKPSVSTARMEVSKKKALYGCGEEIGLDDLTVTYYGADGSVRKLAEKTNETDGYTTNAAQIDTTEPGEKKLVVTYQSGGTVLTAEIILTVTYGLSAENTTVIFPSETYIYDGQPKMPKMSVSYKKADNTTATLEEGTDYTVSYRNNTNACEQPATDSAAPTIIIKGAGSYSGTVTKTFAIGKAAAPEKEYHSVMAAQCAQAQENRKIDLTNYFKDCGAKTGYEITDVMDLDSIFSKTPVTADIKNGVLPYGTKATEEGKTAFLTIKVSFRNYQDASVTVVVCMVAKKAAVISGIEMQDSVYNSAPVSFGGTAVVKAEDGTDLTGKVSLVYHYSGTMADGTAYPAQGGTSGGASGNGTDQEGGNAAEAPVNAGSYKLTVSVKDDDPDYVGSAEYPFTIAKADAVVRAEDMIVLMQAGGGTVSVGQSGVGENPFGYETSGLLNGDKLTTAPSYTVTTDEEGKNAVSSIDVSKTGRYYIQPSNADAGMNYNLTCKPGILTVSEERVAYTVTFDGMGHYDDFRKGGIKSGALLELTEEQRKPAAKEPGYVFAGWYKDKSFAKGKEWNFDTDTVQSDLTLYACWLTVAAQDGNGLKLCVQELPDMVYTGSAQKPAVTVYDSDGETLLKAGKDYTVKYVNNTNAVAVGGDGKPAAGGTASVVNPGKNNEEMTDVIGHFSKDYPYVVITGKGNYAETIYRNFLILPARIDAGDFTLKYTDQLVVNQTKDQKPFGSLKYKKGMKAGTDFTVTLGVAHGEGAFDAGKNPLGTDWKAEGTLNAGKQYTLPAIPKGYSGAFTLTVTGQGNYTGTVIRKLYVSDKQKLMKNASVTLGKNQKTFAYTGKDVELTPGYYNAETKKYHKVTISGTVDAAAAENANDMFLVKAGKNGKTGGESLVWGKDYTIDYAGTNRAAGAATMTLTGINGYVGTKSVTFKITGAKFAANTIDVKAYDNAMQSEPQTDAFRASMPYTGRAVTQNKVKLTTIVTKNNPQAKELTYGEHYTIGYKNNVKKGTATMTFTAKPASGYTGSFKKTFKITPQELKKEKVTVISPDSAAAYSKNGAKLTFTVTDEAGTALREGTDYTVKYKNNGAVTTAQTAENKKPLLTVTGKGNYAGKVEVSFTIIPTTLEQAMEDGTVTVSCAQVQKKNGMKFKDFKFKLVEGKKALGAGGTKDYVIDETKCTPEIIKAYADALAASDASAGADAVLTSLPPEPVVKVTGKNGYAGGADVEIPLGKYIYAEKLTTANLYVIVSEGVGQSVYTGEQVTPAVVVYCGEKAAVSAAKKDKEKDGTKLTAANGKYKLTKLTGETGETDGDYTVSYGANIMSGKNKGSVTVTGAGRYGGSVTVKFSIEKKAIY